MIYKKIKNRFKAKPLRLIYIFYWFLLAYIIAALIFWFFALNKQNVELSYYKLHQVEVQGAFKPEEIKKIEIAKDRKTAQYIGEGVTFLLLIVAGAIFVFRIINKQLIQSRQQQHFMMAITHELKTPIAVTKLNLETLQKRKLNDEQQEKLISSTIQEANRLNGLCNNMLLLSQMDAGGYQLTNENFDLGDLSRECVEDAIIHFPHRKIKSEITKNLLITGDRLLLQLALNNLLDNAVKYSGKNDVVLLKTFKENRLAKLQVIDEGQGIPDIEKVKVFDKFFRGANRQTKGTGLGLYLTKKIVKQHDANISVVNNMPSGSIFEIVFKLNKTSI